MHYTCLSETATMGPPEEMGGPLLGAFRNPEDAEDAEDWSVSKPIRETPKNIHPVLGRST